MVLRYTVHGSQVYSWFTGLQFMVPRCTVHCSKVYSHGSSVHLLWFLGAPKHIHHATSQHYGVKGREWTMVHDSQTGNVLVLLVGKELLQFPQGLVPLSPPPHRFPQSAVLPITTFGF
jgi:hypothetical protein